MPAPGAGPRYRVVRHAKDGCYAFARGQQIFRRDRHAKAAHGIQRNGKRLLQSQRAVPIAGGKTPRQVVPLRLHAGADLGFQRVAQLFHHSGSHRIHHSGQGNIRQLQAAHQGISPAAKGNSHQHHGIAAAQVAGNIIPGVLQRQGGQRQLFPHAARGGGGAQGVLGFLQQHLGCSIRLPAPCPKVAKGFGVGIVLRVG